MNVYASTFQGNSINVYVFIDKACRPGNKQKHLLLAKLFFFSKILTEKLFEMKVEEFAGLGKDYENVQVALLPTRVLLLIERASIKRAKLQVWLGLMQRNRF